MLYVILGYCMPNLKDGSARIKVLCKNDKDSLYWKFTNEGNEEEWFYFASREDADDYIKKNGIINSITYGIRR